MTYETTELLNIPKQIFGKPRSFEIAEIKTNPDKTSRWSIKIKFNEIFEEFYPTYNMHFILNPHHYQQGVEKLIQKLDSKQLSLWEQEQDILWEIQKIKDDYQTKATITGKYDFPFVRLKEYKAENADSSDTITFIVTEPLIKFFLETAPNMHEFAIVLNSTLDDRYAPEYIENLLKGVKL